MLTETTFADGEFGTLYRAFGFDEAGNDLVSETDVRGNVTHYTVDELTSRNEEVTDRCGNKTAYEYDAAGRVTRVANTGADGTAYGTVDYTYDVRDDLAAITRGDGMQYALAYDAFHNLTSIGVQGAEHPLVQYTYKNGNGRLKEITYANGDKMMATYNGLGQMVAEKWYKTTANDVNVEATLVAHYKYVYDNDGNIVRSIDILASKEYTYTYEDGVLTRAAEYTVTVGENEIITARTLLHSVHFIYNGAGNLVKKVFMVDGTEHTVTYENEENRTSATFMVGETETVCSSETDHFGRKTRDELSLNGTMLSRIWAYHDGAVSTEHIDNSKLPSAPTTQLVSYITFSDGRTIAYEYDAEERITKVVDNTNGKIVATEYTYDALGQLLTEKVNGNLVNRMTYDSYGNILSKNGVRYIYDNVWRDKLIAYGDEKFTYDAQGNPTTYRGHALTWEKGRQLKSFDNIQYTYNANGIRTSKMVNGVEHTYMLDGTKILREVWGGNALMPLYDNEDSVCGIVYNGTPYYFLKNLQGDVIAIVDKEAKTVAKYSYDAWGKVVAVLDADSVDISSNTMHIANVNPYRYRGYYYDTETGLYYLQSRYYDAGVGRFINTDEIENALCTNNLLDHNTFTYVQNNPIVLSDSAGESWITDLWKKAQKGVSSAWNWIKKTGSNIGGFVKNTVWKTWIVKGAWQTFCKKWIWEKFCKEMVYNTFLKKWIWQTFCKKWTWQTFCKKWVWQTFCKKWVWQTFCKDWIANKTWNWLKSNWKKCVDWVANIAGGASALVGILSIPAIGLFSIPVAGQIALGILGIACFIWTTIRLLGF